MIGGMIAATVALSMFSLQEDPALGTLVPAILVALLLAMAGCALLNATIERVAYRPLRRAPRLVPLITAIGVSFILQNVALIWKGSAPVAMPRSLPDGPIFTIGTCPDCVVYTLESPLPDPDHGAGPHRARLARPRTRGAGRRCAPPRRTRTRRR